MTRRGRAGAALLGLGLALSAVALLDPRREGLWLPATLLALAGFLAAREAARAHARALALALALAWSAGAWVQPVFRSDAPEFFVYLPSLAFDHDLDFSNDWLALGYDHPPPRTSQGLPGNKHPIGPALVWSPFYLAAHAYVAVDHALGGPYLPTGYAPPYRRSVALGTLAVVVLGSALLLRVLERQAGRGAARWALVALLGASPLLFYALVASSMSHGAAFGVAAALVFALDRLRRAPTRGAWLLAGALLGLVTLTRWQAAVLALAFVPVALALWRERRLRVADGLLAVGAALLAFVPQMLAWRRLYGSLVTMPQGGGFVDWSSPHLLETLFSADHGLFTWTPLTALGLLGLLALVRREGALAWGALLACAATAWVNGGVDDWAAGEAFGARRYDVVLPFLGLGLGQAVRLGEAWGRRRPLAAPALVVLLAVAWNVGFASQFRQRLYGGPLPLERLAAHQARGLRERAQSLLFELAGPRAAAFAYGALSGEYLFTQWNASGRLRLAQMEEHELRGSWSQPQRGPGGGSFRWLRAPEGCLRVPLAAPMDFPATLRAQAPRPFGELTLAVSLNGQALGALRLGDAWRDHPLELPVARQQPGENWLCLALAGPADAQVAVAVAELARTGSRAAAPLR